MLLDEPSMGLAPLLMLAVFGLPEANQPGRGTAVFLVEQNARLALQFAAAATCLKREPHASKDDPKISWPTRM